MLKIRGTGLTTWPQCHTWEAVGHLGHNCTKGIYVALTNLVLQLGVHRTKTFIW